ncbi:DUF262 domain-containing protein [Aliarcobacter butzleri]|uniref:DUF262 domain-containing protein n=1 Tax=Aliarcobacter butzleri TaxID=28197 RepID=UPI002B24CCA5|nr:DUF262 domain-containing protein [Aliarcobacter butzleri]
MSKNLELKPINSLLKEKFYIPSYQRGYRWSKEQVKDLLNDIWEFTQKDKSKDEFYCLQPIVVLKEKYFENDKELIRFRVVDGQQRLTTIFILLTYLDKQKYTLTYETRKDSEEFLKKLSLNNISHSNIDYFHISEALETIANWFDTKEEKEDEYTAKDELYITLGKYTKFIWYEVEEKSQDEIDVFTRINMGKIPLTNAELVKALLLRSDNFKEDDDYIKLKQLEIASEWDTIEYKLQDNNFWYFLNNTQKDTDKDTRIEFIFDLIANVPKDNEDSFFTFHYFNQILNDDQKQIDEIWKLVKKYFMTFVEWYENNELYHLIGYLISIGVTIKEIEIESQNLSKDKFIDHLEEQIMGKLSKIKLDDLEYGKNDQDIKKVLLLHNIVTLIENGSQMRFPFDKYKDKGEKWSLEHIHAQNSKGLDSSETRKAWLIETIKDIEKINDLKSEQKFSIIEQINRVIEKNKIDENEFNEIQQNIFKLFGDYELHTIDNLALLSGRHNSKLNNSIFPAKRDIIIELDKNGSFIPICTKNVFLKYFSKNLSQVYFWSQDDRNDYFKDIEEKLVGKYLKNTAEEENN